ncbi:hypothetical protein KI688_005157 [Linnemannia hyalina]|uniref:Uncharacterized protein n=1 Tax=Linnemannia hyalina TaxID=64524 RepID=A0A9P7XK45_9FUNG|nr:hypothetical protein KI688_005157 [Linnemannia hyalina]
MSALSTASRRSLTFAHMDHGKNDTIKSAPLWRDENATESEADVKADREPLPSDLHELQRESVETIQSKYNGSQMSGSNH